MVRIDFGWYMTVDGNLVRINRPTDLKQGPPSKNFVQVKPLSLRERFREVAKMEKKASRMRALGKLSSLIRGQIRMERHNATVNKYLGIDNHGKNSFVPNDDTVLLLEEIENLKRGIE